MYNIIQYTYNKDEILTLLSIGSILNSFKHEDIDKILIVNDGNNPISENSKNKLLELSNKVKIIDTFYNRNENIRGPEHFNSFIDLMINEFDEKGITIKIDPDTLIIDNFIFDIIKNDDNIFYMGDFSFSSWYAIGYCYAFKNSILKGIKEGLNIKGLKDLCGEDCEFGLRALYYINNFDLKNQKMRDIKVRDIKKHYPIKGYSHGIVRCYPQTTLEIFLNILKNHPVDRISIVNLGLYSEKKWEKKDQVNNLINIYNELFKS